MTVSFNACRRDQEEGVELGFQRSPGEDKSRDVELGSEGMSHGLLLQAVPQQRCNGYCLCDSEVETASVWYTSATQWRGPHCINIAVVLAVVHSLLGLSGSKRAKKRKKEKNHYPSPPPSPSLISHFASVDIKQHLYLLTLGLTHRVCHFWQDLYFALSLE